MSWSESLIKLSTYEVETLQKRLAEIQDRSNQLVMRLSSLTAQGEAEITAAAGDAAQSRQLTAYLEGLKARKLAVKAEIDAVALEELGARDALSRAFEEQKKYEQVAETARRLQMVDMARRETAAFDELGLRRATR